ncbi:MAG: aminotransferase class IV family protein [Bacteroides sp.]|jgi:4-amino-4-deoxychorismate lyase|nr:aminotransferase class IV family protein [Bacteroides sp.]
MCQFIETIRIENGQIYNLPYHNQRFNDTRAEFYKDSQPIDLANFIKIPTPQEEWNTSNRIKCRVLYSHSVKEITYAPYLLHPIHTLKLINCNEISYSYKSVDRSLLSKLHTQRGEADDILIIKNGLLTDTSIANIALFDGTHWYTPSAPLLKGTQRASLLEKEILVERTLTIDTLYSFQQIALFNAMILFGEICLPVNQTRISF